MGNWAISPSNCVLLMVGQMSHLNVPSWPAPPGTSLSSSGCPTFLINAPSLDISWLLRSHSPYVHALDSGFMATTANPPSGVPDYIEPPFPDTFHRVPDCDYDPWLLEDHPLRSPPTECCPAVSCFFRSCYHAVKNNWSERVFRLVCVLLILLYVYSLFKFVGWLMGRTDIQPSNRVVLQSLAVIPYGRPYRFPKIWREGDWFWFQEQT